MFLASELKTPSSDFFKNIGEKRPIAKGRFRVCFWLEFEKSARPAFA
ncbi:hypothetical protein ACQKRQ_26125 [Paraburkholderia sp. NPDC080076]|jgi:hypothetical protein